MINYIKQLFCKHSYRYHHSQPTTTIQGYRVTRNVYECMKCGKVKLTTTPRSD